MRKEETRLARRQASFQVFRFVLMGLFMAAVLAWPGGLAAKDKDLRPSRQVTGLVSDKSDNPISGATVTLTDLETGKKLASYTGDDGKYLFSGLETTRDYEVQATFKGVSSRPRKVTTIDPRNKITLNLQIPPPKEEE
ncbi:MAG: carboxypeptidase regulatory-like domain-containing protein [Acidobacteria bacterium]|nr:carboxypeptidase regulatory-like domain-containing protein [Acidobacteriota bacterium]